MIPTIEKVRDMKSRYPALNNYVNKLEERYRTILKIIDSSSLSNDIKTARKNTYYLFLMIIKKLFNEESYRCFISLKDCGILINSDTYKLKYYDDLLLDLLNNYELVDSEYYGDHVLVYKIALQHEKVRERTNEN